MSPSAKAKTAIVTARSPSESPRIATAKTLLTAETETKTGTERRNEGTAMRNPCPTDVTAKTAHVATQTHRLFAGIAGTRAAATATPYH